MAGTAKTGVLYLTTLANGTFHLTGTAQGTITFVPDNPADASASGHFAPWFGENGNLHKRGRNEHLQRGLVRLRRFAGRRARHVPHQHQRKRGSITFDKPHLTCG